ncbi:hypothetical protein BH10ACI1_BH10ACI1_14440 [soil metagenome]
MKTPPEGGTQKFYMNQKRWQKIKGLFDAALEIESQKREKFLKNACGNDGDLRREVENLLASFDSSDDFMEKPAVREVASLIIERNAKLKNGQKIAHYEIVRQIGEGGMGEVYLAKDVRLNRKVALKVLPEHLIGDKSRLYRFEQEARAASALNHPNIITIHEIGVDKKVHFITTEFVEGETLRQIIFKNQGKISETLDIAVQIASALSVAHSAGVIHRDIKPENVMIRPDGIVKLLDFGLAKLTEETVVNYESLTQKFFATKPGMIMGTVSYMSPEQASGGKTDYRTDFWSLGVVLYEILSGGKLPFTGKTVNHTLVAIMENEPPQLGNIPREIENLVFKLLEKIPANRYQTGNDLLQDLKFGVSPSSGNLKELKTKFLEAKPSEGGTQNTNSIAVLPFSIIGFNEDEEYLSLGLADALITQLSRTKKLAVRPTSAVRGFANSDKNSTEIGRELNVGSILEGSLRRIGEQMRITVQLVDTESKNSLWAKKFDIEFADIFAVEDEITTQVADALLLNLNSDEHRRIENRGTTNPEAYQAYLQGRYFWNKFIPEDLPKAIEAFEKAVLLDPNFAGAYAGIARAYRYILGLQSMVESQKAKEKMLWAATNALALDDSLAEAHLAVAEIKMDEWDWEFAEREYKRAIALNPNLADARAGYANFLSITERIDEAFAQIERALELDPLSSRLRNMKGKILFIARRYDEAIKLFKKVIKIEPDNALAHYSLGYAFACKKMFAEAISQYQKALSMSDASPDEFLGYAYAQAGQTSAALETLERVKDKKDVSPAELAVIYVGLGDKDAAFAALEKGYETHDLQMQYLRVEQHYDSLRDDPRFTKILRRVGLEETASVSPNIIGEQDKKPTTEMQTEAIQTPTADAEIIHSTSSAAYIVTEIKRHKGGALIFLVILALILTGATAIYFYTASQKTKISSIAVLPFQNASGDAGLEYLFDGLSESLTDKLAQIGQLKVIAQSSTFRYKNKEFDPKEAGQTLGVEVLLMGKITKSGDNLSIRVELINARDGTIIWNEKYNLDSPNAVTDTQLVQNRIALQTVKNLNINLTDIQDKQLTKYAAQNAQAYQLYLNAALLKRKNPSTENMKKAVDYYNQAIALDPNFALAYTALANSYRILQYSVPNSERKEIEEKMYQAIARAQELDAGLPEVFTTLGGIKMNELDLPASEQAYRRALELSPNSAVAHSGYANYLTNTGRFDEALTQIRIAEQLDPLSVNLKVTEGRILFIARRYDEAIRYLQNLAKAAPDNSRINFILAESYTFKGMYAEALAEFEKNKETGGKYNNEFYLFALAKSGKIAEARQELEKLKKRESYSPAEFAVAYVALGEKEQALDLLEKAFDERDPQLQFLKVEPGYDDIRPEPRFQELLRKVGF